MAAPLTPFPNALVVQLLDVARELASQRGRPSRRQAAMRRAVSSAYYAVFHALCSACVSGLAGRSRALLSQQIYRALDHGTARRRLAEREAWTIHPTMELVGASFRILQDQRHLADYAPPEYRLSRPQTLASIEQAAEVVTLIQAWDGEARTRVAVHLLVATRRTA